jgi:hypothetical protein
MLKSITESEDEAAARDIETGLNLLQRGLKRHPRPTSITMQAVWRYSRHESVWRYGVASSFIWMGFMMYWTVLFTQENQLITATVAVLFGVAYFIFFSAIKKAALWLLVRGEKPGGDIESCKQQQQQQRPVNNNSDRVCNVQQQQLQRQYAEKGGGEEQEEDEESRPLIGKGRMQQQQPLASINQSHPPAIQSIVSLW